MRQKIIYPPTQSDLINRGYAFDPYGTDVMIYKHKDRFLTAVWVCLFKKSVKSPIYLDFVKD